MLGGVGSLMILVGSVFSLLSLARYVFPSVGLAFTVFTGLLAVLSFVGFILFMIAMNGLANSYKDRGIFDNALYGIIIIIVGGVIAGAVAFFLVLSSILHAGLNTPSTLDSVLPTITGSFIPLILIGAVFGLVQAWFFYRAFSRLAAKSQVSLFRTGGLLFMAGVAVSMTFFLIGAVLVYADLVPVEGMFVMGSVGGVVSYAAWALVTTSFFRIKSPASQVFQPHAAQVVVPSVGQVKYCSHCGAENRVDAVFCTRCGKSLVAQ
jgi:uncharacterized membrane protein/ribosomal protein L40E